MMALKCLFVTLILFAAAVSVALIWQYVAMKRSGIHGKYQLGWVVFLVCWNFANIVNCIRIIFNIH